MKFASAAQVVATPPFHCLQPVRPYQMDGVRFGSKFLGCKEGTQGCKLTRRGALPPFLPR